MRKLRTLADLEEFDFQMRAGLVDGALPGAVASDSLPSVAEVSGIHLPGVIGRSSLEPYWEESCVKAPAALPYVTAPTDKPRMLLPVKHRAGNPGDDYKDEEDGGSLSPVPPKRVRPSSCGSTRGASASGRTIPWGKVRRAFLGEHPAAGSSREAPPVVDQPSPWHRSSRELAILALERGLETPGKGSADAIKPLAATGWLPGGALQEQECGNLRAAGDAGMPQAMLGMLA